MQIFVPVSCGVEALAGEFRLKAPLQVIPCGLLRLGITHRLNHIFSEATFNFICAILIRLDVYVMHWNGDALQGHPETPCHNPIDRAVFQAAHNLFEHFEMIVRYHWFLSFTGIGRRVNSPVSRGLSVSLPL